MVESASNLLWLVMCIAALGVWVRSSRPQQNPAQRAQAIRAIALIALLLLPVVSLSDDLQMDFAAPPPPNANAFVDCGFSLLRLLLALLFTAALSFHDGVNFASTRNCSFITRLSSNVTKRPPPLYCA